EKGSCSMSSAHMPDPPGTWEEFIGQEPIRGLREANEAACATLEAALRRLLQAIDVEYKTTKRFARNEDLWAALSAALQDIGRTLAEVGAERAPYLWDHATDIDSYQAKQLLQVTLWPPSDIPRGVGEQLQSIDLAGGREWRRAQEYLRG